MTVPGAPDALPPVARRSGPPRSIAVIGGGNQVAATLVPRLLAAGRRVIVCSRRSRPAWIAPEPRLEWLPEPPSDRPALAALVHLAPLDLFERLRAGFGAIGRLVVFSSTSIVVKRESPSAPERALAQALADGEAAIVRSASAEGSALAILRPTLVYGAGLDANLTRLAAWARRRRWFPLVAGGRGLRQPVHADDLAALAARLATRATEAEGTWDLPGGETLSYRMMVERVYASLHRRPRFVPLAAGLVRAAAALARATPGLPAVDPAVLLRMGENLTFDGRPARRDLGFEPRRFEPTAETWRLESLARGVRPGGG